SSVGLLAPSGPRTMAVAIQGRRASFASRLPLANFFRAFGANPSSPSNLATLRCVQEGGPHGGG
ncbi:MAG TPA: hypothetical protein VJS64_19860, partial [Pyrinomonadaceae bacterium]|nr:hypothetical protein [Pyrinomonadaceae bacterium]